MGISTVPDLQPWHKLSSRLEPRAAEINSTFTLEAYLAREEAVFNEARALVDEKVSPTANALIPNRYVLGSRSHPDRIATQWNRTQILTTPAPRGGALLIHGLTDSPYSMRAIAERLNAGGFFTLSLRMQGHGTVPGGLINTTWEDWSAAVRMGARSVRDRIGADRPLILVGYSNGGALVTKYALDALEDASLPPPSKLLLVSAMIGVSPAARFASIISLLGPVVPKARWIDVVPEYNPFKYNSFPANAGAQTARLTGALNAQLLRAGRERRLSKMPPVLAFQSLVDTTVSSPAVVDDLFEHLPPGQSELVVFDLNRQSGVDAFTRPGAILPQLIGERQRSYAVTLVTNANPSTLDAVAMSVAAGAGVATTEALGLSWPESIYSLSHVALPFTIDDPIYGGEGRGRELGSVALGRLSPRGEKGALIVPAEVLMRMTWNPFFPYLAQRIDRWVTDTPPR
ncbi:MAG TPA: alpha/beta fold hydrolase [Vicinamibacterales bacterium]|nr:alpha/beta fold hydrolase [Vicinamibacterales bacterium]